NVQVTADVLLSATAAITSEVIARGSGLDTNAPTYYALAITPGSGPTTLQLEKLVNGTATVLASLSADAITPPGNHWVQATLTASGSGLQASVFSLDTNQYLNSSGHWVAPTGGQAPPTALAATDGAISSAASPAWAGAARSSARRAS